jgi:hypothetical protein
MTIIRHDLISGTVTSPHLPRVLYENFFRDGTLTASSEAVGKPKELAVDGLTYDAWTSTGGATEWLRTQLSGAESADAMAVLGHNLTGCTVTPQRSTNGSSWTDLHAGYVVPDDKPIVWEFAGVSDVYWRLLIENAASAVHIAALQVGTKLTLQKGLPSGWRPPELNEERMYTNVMSEGGQILGRNVIRRGVAVEVDTPNADYVWAREDWADFIAVAERYAVFFWWVYGAKAEIMFGGVQESEARFSNEIYVAPRFRLAGMTR